MMVKSGKEAGYERKNEGGIQIVFPLPERRWTDRLNTIVVLMRREIAQLDPNWRATPTVVLWSSVD